MNIHVPRRDGGGPSLVGGIVLAVFVAVNVAAGPDALEGSVMRAADAGRAAVATVVRRAAELAIRFGAMPVGASAEPPETCSSRARLRGSTTRSQRGACEIRLRCDGHGSAWSAPAVEQTPARPWFCPSPT